jgi:hypothetical protein
MLDEHTLQLEARFTVVEELLFRIYAILVANEHDPHRALIQFSEGLKQEICRDSRDGSGASNDQTSRLSHALDRAVELIRVLIINGQPIPGCEEDVEVEGLR